MRGKLSEATAEYCCEWSVNRAQDSEDQQAIYAEKCPFGTGGGDYYWGEMRDVLNGLARVGYFVLGGRCGLMG